MPKGKIVLKITNMIYIWEYSYLFMFKLTFSLTFMTKELAEKSERHKFVFKKV